VTVEAGLRVMICLYRFGRRRLRGTVVAVCCGQVQVFGSVRPTRVWVSIQHKGLHHLKAFVRIPGPILSPDGPNWVAPRREASACARPGSFVVRNPGPILSGLATLGCLHREASKVPVLVVGFSTGSEEQLLLQ
jgi:hypothetical protein